MILKDLLSKNRIAPRVFSKRVKGINGLTLYTDKEIWRPKPGETLMLVAGWVICMDQKGAATDSNNFEMEVNNSDVVATVSGPNRVGQTNRLAMVSVLITFTNALPLTYTSTDAGTGSILTQDLVLIAIKI